jgi:hypothetical protein
MTYRLVDADIAIQSTGSGGFFDTYLTTGADGGGDLTATLPTGNYAAYLETWSLQVEDASGNFQPVVATVVSSTYQYFTIYNDSSTTITFTFKTDGVIVVVGSGTLSVGIDVNTPDAACTPLGSDCGAGFWCPPATLTGADLTCVPAGTVAVGQPCASPADCVANATCTAVVDGGAAVCTALCSSDIFTHPCAGGGTCNSVTSDYGLCEGVDGGAPEGGP